MIIYLYLLCIKKLPNEYLKQAQKKRQPKLSLFIEVTTRFELVIRELQSLALPLGYVTKI